MIDEPIAFDKWMTRADATVNIYVGFEVEFAGTVWTARGNTASARGESATSVAVDYVPHVPEGTAPLARRHPCTKDGARVAGEQISEFLRTGRLAKE